MCVYTYIEREVYELYERTEVCEAPTWRADLFAISLSVSLPWLSFSVEFPFFLNIIFSCDFCSVALFFEYCVYSS